MPRQCENCGKPLVPSQNAPHKRFCGAYEGDSTGRCRQEWHDARRARALRALQDAEAKGAARS